MSHEGAPSPVVNPDGSVNEAFFSERGLKVNLEQRISQQVGDKFHEGTIGEMFQVCPYIGEMVNKAHINSGPDAAIMALNFVGMTAGVEIVAPIETAAEEINDSTQKADEAEPEVKKNWNQIFPQIQ